MKTIALICGGQSPEHEISIRSAKNILQAIDRKKFKVLLIGIDRKGTWRWTEESKLGKIISSKGIPLGLVPGKKRGKIIRLDTQKAIPNIDAVFPILHGPYGEDGTVQGLLRVLDLPFVGPDVLGSSVAMDKEFAKRLLKEAGLNVAKGFSFHHYEKDKIKYATLARQLGKTMFVKPANMGSSVGVHKVKNKKDLDAAIADAFLYDRKIIIEEMIVGKELEFAVLGNDHPVVSCAGEIVTPEEYSYEAKYISQTAAQIIIPAKITKKQQSKLQAVALQAYKVLGGEVMARVDMFLTPKGNVYVNELNTLPGFTSISMYPKLMEDYGLSYTELVTQLIQFAISRYKAQKALKTEF